MLYSVPVCGYITFWPAILLMDMWVVARGYCSAATSILMYVFWHTYVHTCVGYPPRSGIAAGLRVAFSSCPPPAHSPHCTDSYLVL